MSKVVKNYIFNLSYQILVIILPIVTTPYISRVLAPEGIGAYNYSYSIVSLVIIGAQLGTALYGQREIAYIQNSINKRSVVFAEILLIRLIATILIIPIYELIIFFNSSYSIILSCMYIYIIANIFDISWFYQGLEEFKKIAIRNVIVKISGIISIFAFVHEKDDLLLYVEILAISQLLGNLLLWKGLNKKIVLREFLNINIRKHIKPIIVLFLPTAAMYLYVYVDKIILGLLSNDAQVGFYSQAEKIARLLLTIITSLGAVLLPHISYAVNNNKTDLIVKDVNVAISYVLHIGVPMVIGSIIIAPRFIPVFLGTDYMECISLFQALSVLIVIIGLASVVGQSVLIPMKKQKMYSISILYGALSNIILDIILIPFLGAMGAAIGTIVAETTVTSIQIYFVNKLLDLNIYKTFIKSYKCILAALIMGIIGFILTKYINSGLIPIFIIILCCIALYIILLIILDDKEFNQFYIKLRVCLKNKFI